MGGIAVAGFTSGAVGIAAAVALIRGLSGRGSVLLTTALALLTRLGQRSLFAHGRGGFSETLYAHLSQGNNNGSAPAGYTGFIQPGAPAPSGSPLPASSAARR